MTKERLACNSELGSKNTLCTSLIVQLLMAVNMEYFSLYLQVGTKYDYQNYAVNLLMFLKFQRKARLHTREEIASQW